MNALKPILHHRYTKLAGLLLAFLALGAWCTVLVARPINLSTADLGRHITNGKVWMEGADRWQMLHTNYYSYTNQNFPFVNHHWGSGVVFYGLYQLVGFTGLSVVYVLLSVVMAGWFMWLAIRKSNLVLAILAAAAFVPMAVSRAEVRPEVFTYLLCGIYYWLLDAHRGGRSSGKALYWLIPLTALWINLHIGFIVGIGITFVFWLEQAVQFVRKRPNSAPFLTIILAGSALAALLNPAGLWGVVYPLNIFRHYGYLIVENQSIFFLQRLGINSMGYLVVMVAITWTSFAARAIHERKITDWPLLILNLVFAFMAAKALRNYPFFALFGIVALAANIHAVIKGFQKPAARKVKAGVMAVAVVLAAGWVGYDIQRHWGMVGVGLMPGVNGAAEFYKQHGLKGPIFNNYDIGGYLIFHLHGQDAVFVDNRPEAYSESFLQDVYVKAQEDPQMFDRLDSEYHFNTVFFYYHDLTPWAQQFLIRMVHDPAWSPVYVDYYNLILVRRNQQNAQIIQQFGLPQNMFGVTQ